MAAVLAGVIWLDSYLGSAGGAAWLRGAPLTAVLVMLVLGGFREVGRMARNAQVRVLPTSGILASIALATAPWWLQWIAGGATADCLIMLVGLIMLAVFCEQMIRNRTDDALRGVACTFLAVMYLGFGGAMVLTIRMSYSVGVLLMFLAAVKGTDIGAYFTGSAIGRHKMIPWLSPGKSWEGLVGGVVSAAGAAVLMRYLFNIEIDLGLTVAFGCIVGLVGQFGDLCESLLKRSSNVKDSGSVLPEFGGVLDIVDSPLLAAPAAYLILHFFWQG